MEAQSSFYSKNMPPTRTAGDGMESIETSKEQVNQMKPARRISSKDSLLPPRLIQVYPTFIPRSGKKKSYTHSKSPKFVPYEPYAAAVKPMTPKFVSKGNKRSRNNMDINKLINQMSQMNTDLSEFKPRPKLTSQSSEKNIELEKPFPEKVEMQKRIDDLLNENQQIKEQLNQQVQVNKELKTMLVASMGEDLETQVQSLTEDKKHLANALLNSAQHLSTHQEQTEWLAGQCEVWRSKFLASSLMIEELANCKKILTEKTDVLQQAIKQMFEDRCRAREMMVCTYRNLYSLHERWLEHISIQEYVGSNSKMYNRPIGNLNFNATIPHSANLIDLASVNMKLSDNISSSVQKQEINHLDDLPTLTDGEAFAENAIAMPVEIRRLGEEPVNALVSHAYNNSTKTSKPVASCVHCNGKIQLL